MTTTPIKYCSVKPTLQYHNLESIAQRATCYGRRLSKNQSLTLEEDNPTGSHQEEEGLDHKTPRNDVLLLVTLLCNSETTHRDNGKGVIR
mmetsp:Transcript_25446/g.33177  ORF Transcript_25446/g.33177 Transcript_25446/m.33177 type:complete len:90 (+) Transcript_25446:1001-1270(+)